jgi:hypothetical protein
MAKKEEKKILVWDGIFQGYKHITKEEMKDRKILQEKMQKQFKKALGIGIIIAVGIVILLLLFLLG